MVLDVLDLCVHAFEYKVCKAGFKYTMAMIMY